MTNEKKIYRRDTPTFDVSVTESDGTVFNLTGYEITMTVKVINDDSDNNAVIGPITGTIIDASAGTARIEMSSTDTDVSEGTYMYKIKIYNSSTKQRHTIVQAPFQVVNS